MKYDRYRQRSYAEYVYLNGFQSSYISRELQLLALYMRDTFYWKPLTMRYNLVLFCEQNLPNFNLMRDCLLIRKALNYAKDKNHILIEIPYIPVYQSEIDFINSLPDNENVRRTIFTMIIHKKIDAQCYNQNHPDGEPYTFFSYANNSRLTAIPHIGGIRLKKGEKFGITVMHEIFKLGLIETIQTVGSPLKLNFADKIAMDGEEVLRVYDFEKIGLYYNYIFKDKKIGNRKIGLCKICHCPFTYTSHNERIYCDEHRKGNVKMNKNMFYTCEECGMVFLRRNNAHTQVLCSNCKRKKNQKLRKVKTSENP